jgi:EAL domain-containing protein (putative c-di-GMP-specific phosphodiesterase class I)
MLVQTIITLAHAFRMSAVAEGVESDEQLDTLIELGCDRVQG